MWSNYRGKTHSSDTRMTLFAQKFVIQFFCDCGYGCDCDEDFLPENFYKIIFYGKFDKRLFSSPYFFLYSALILRMGEQTWVMSWN